MPYTLPALPYALDALEPTIDAKTMEIHSQKHHAAYVTNANNALKDTKWADLPVEHLLPRLAEIPDDKRAAVRNNAGGHYNHSLFWEVMAPSSAGGGGKPAGELSDALSNTFGSLDAFKTQFADAGAKRFGSGWSWLYWDKAAAKLAVASTANQDSPLMGKALAGCEGVPLLGLDVWEHAYYLKYQNRRPDYIAAWWNVVNWPRVAKNLAAARR